MSNRPFFDTAILVYALSEGDPRAAVAEGLLAAGGHIGVQVLNEFTAVARRKLNRTWDEIGDALAAVRTLCEPPSPLTVQIHDAGLAIAAQYGYHIYDALILAAALDAECDILSSEDMQDGQKIGDLTIRNPFISRGTPI